MGKLTRAIGLMSGTSLDGIDVALLETDGENSLRHGPSATVPYEPEMRALLAAALEDAAHLTSRAARPGVLAKAEAALTQLHADAVQNFCAANGVSGVDVVGFHGQTVLHRPQARLTVQLGDGPALANAIGIPVIFDLRAADVAAGGQGAPLVPVYHRALANGLPQRPVVMANIGGVANVTWIGADDQLIAFDTGPGNALLDDWMARHTGTPCDVDGATAASGRVYEPIVNAALCHAYFAQPPPKTLDRRSFHAMKLDTLTLADGAATLTALTAQSLARAREHFPSEPALWVISGGGRRNGTLMRMLAGIVQNAVVPAEAVGLNGDSLEAEAWAYLAVRSMRGLPITFPGTTGVPAALTGGILAKPGQPPRAPTE